ncbi:hypothetical protein LCGC14_2249080 [marine sediment metagenome]|uniref:Uncharacterized protein n=1 Tax=marine sediment metagenome TaxID=412755 RepID=A0A0F9FFN5_9ZZZZ
MVEKKACDCNPHLAQLLSPMALSPPWKVPNGEHQLERRNHLILHNLSRLLQVDFGEAMSERLSAEERAKVIVNEYRNNPPVLPYDIEQWITQAIKAAEKVAAEAAQPKMCPICSYRCLAPTMILGETGCDHCKAVVEALRRNREG